MAEKKQKQKRLFFTGVLLFVNLLFVILLLLVYISVYINPNKISLFSFIGMAYPVILALNLIMAFFWIFVRFKFSFISLVAIAIGWSHLTRLVQLKLPSENENTTNSIKILSYNIQNFVALNVSNTKYITNFENQVKITKFINEQKADIVCLQEVLYDRGEVSKFAKEFGKMNNTPNYYFRNYHHVKNDKLDGLAIFSRFPVINRGHIDHEKKTIGIFIDLIINHDTIRIYNLHLASIHFRKEEYDFISDFSHQQDQETIKKHSLRVLTKIRTAFIKRGFQTDIITRQIKDSPHPVILCGDFNDTPSSYTYQKIFRLLYDAFIESGKGFGVTYAGESFPSFRIDYIFYDPIFKSVNFSRHKKSFSDHYPISSTLVLRNQKNNI